MSASSSRIVLPSMRGSKRIRILSWRLLLLSIRLAVLFHTLRHFAFDSIRRGVNSDLKNREEGV